MKFSASLLCVSLLPVAWSLPPSMGRAPADATEFEPNSYFYIANNCKHRNTGNRAYKNGYDFYVRAIKDAKTIAHAALKWPLLGTDSSDLYFGRGTESSRWKDEIRKNYAAAEKWEDPKIGFDPYIILDCQDRFGACGGKIGKDPRIVACYVNNTRDLWSARTDINCCDPFFNSDTNYQIRREYKEKKELDLRWMQTSGSLLLHEIMHSKKITQDRRKIIDQTFTNSGKRIYGPKDVAKGARAEDKDIMTANADSYALVALSMYWKDVFGFLPQPEIKNSAAPEGHQDIITDSSDNYPPNPDLNPGVGHDPGLNPGLAPDPKNGKKGKS